MTRLILAHFILLLTMSQVLAQKRFSDGYVVTFAQDTIVGKINVSTNEENSVGCDFMFNDGSVKYFTASDIESYKISDGKYYVNKRVKVNEDFENYFLEYLVDGIVDLYFLKRNKLEYYFIEKDSIYLIPTDQNSSVSLVDKETGLKKEYIRTSTRYRGMLRYLFQDSPELLGDIQSVKLDYNSMIDITKKYHYSVCDDLCVEYSKSSEKVVFIETIIGVKGSSMGLDNSKDKNTNTSLSAGLNVRFLPNKGFKALNLLFGLHVSNFNIENGDFYHTNSNLNTGRSHRINTDYLLICMPLIMEYSFNLNRARPFLFIGYQSNLLLNSNHKVNEVFRNDTFEWLGPELEMPFRKYHYGITGGTGMKYYNSDDSYWKVSLGLDFREPAAVFGAILDFQNVWTLNFELGYGFKIN